MSFLHGIELIELDDGVRPIGSAGPAVIGLVGTAPDASDAFPYHTPQLITNIQQAKELGTSGTLPQALQGIFNQTAAQIVMIRVPFDKDEGNQLSNIIGSLDPETGKRTGLLALLDAESTVHRRPTLLIAPGFSHELAVAQQLQMLAERLRAIAILDAPCESETNAMDYREQLGSDRLFLVYPLVQQWDNALGKAVDVPASPNVTGLICKVDKAKGFWCSPSNQIINGILGTSIPIEFALSHPEAQANRLNEQSITTIIQQDGFRLWGNRTLSSDPKWAFLSVRRTADNIEEALLRAHLWAVDRNLTKTYFDEVCEGVNAYLRDLTSQGAILGGTCWVNPEFNSTEQLQQGHACFDFDFTPPTPAERITFRAELSNQYFDSALK